MGFLTLEGLVCDGDSLNFLLLKAIFLLYPRNTESSIQGDDFRNRFL